jgi:hypothetical protein
MVASVCWAAKPRARSRWRPARPIVPVLGSSQEGDHAVWGASSAPATAVARGVIITSMPSPCAAIVWWAGAPSADTGNPTVNPIEQQCHLGRIVGVLIREGLRDDHAAAGIDRQMQFATFPARPRTMFCLQPLACPVDL